MKNKIGRKLKGFYSRGYLSHFDGGDIWQSVTFSLRGSIPRRIMAEINKKAPLLKNKDQVTARFSMMETYLDHSDGILKKETYAQAVVEVLFSFNRTLYDLAAFVVMSNHVHLLFKLKNGAELSVVVAAIKSQSAAIINNIRGRTGSLWQLDYYDRYIRNDQHWYNVLEYIERNPVKAKICRYPKEFKYSSAYCRSHNEYPTPHNFKLKPRTAKRKAIRKDDDHNPLNVTFTPTLLGSK